MFFKGISANHYRFRCHPMKSFIFLLEDPILDIKKQYSDAFVGAVPRSRLLEKAFDTISSFITSGTLPFHSDNLKVNSKGYSSIPEIFMEVINYLVHHYIDDFQPTQEHLCNKFGIQSLDKKEFSQMKTILDAAKIEQIMNDSNP